jgi:hypothetical protein
MGVLFDSFAINLESYPKDAWAAARGPIDQMADNAFHQAGVSTSGT